MTGEEELEEEQMNEDCRKSAEALDVMIHLLSSVTPLTEYLEKLLAELERKNMKKGGNKE